MLAYVVRDKISKSGFRGEVITLVFSPKRHEGEGLKLAPLTEWTTLKILLSVS